MSKSEHGSKQSIVLDLNSLIIAYNVDLQWNLRGYESKSLVNRNRLNRGRTYKLFFVDNKVNCLCIFSYSRYLDYKVVLDNKTIGENFRTLHSIHDEFVVNEKRA